MGWDGEIGHGTPLQDISFSTIKTTIHNIYILLLYIYMHIYVYIYTHVYVDPGYHKIWISEQGIV